MRKRMKKKFVAICISLAITLTGPGMSMVTMTYADEITKENQQDQEISYLMIRIIRKTGKTVIQMTEKRQRMI